MQPYYSRLRVTTGGVPSVAPARVGEALGHNPQIGLVDLVDAVRRRAAGIVALDRGPGRGFGAEIEPGPRLHP